MAAIISDTLMFRSPTCTSIDRMAAEKLSEICGVEIEEFAIDMFSAGSDMSSRTPKEIFNQDKKKFQVGDHSFIVAQINSMNAIELEEVKEKLVPYLEEKFDGLGVNMCFVMLNQHCKGRHRASLFREKAKDVARSAFQLPADLETIVLKGLVSRKKQLIPSIVTRTTTVKVKQNIKRAFVRMPLFYAFFIILIKVINNKCRIISKS